MLLCRRVPVWDFSAVFHDGGRKGAIMPGLSVPMCWLRVCVCGFVLLLGGCALKVPPPTGAQAALVRLDTESRRHVRHDDTMRRDTERSAPMKLDVSAVRPLLDEATVLPSDHAARAERSNAASLAPEAVLPDGQELHIDDRHQGMDDGAPHATGSMGKAGGTGATSIDIPNADGSITHVEPDGTVRTEKLVSRPRSRVGAGRGG